jgi:hypothetical protein
MRGRNTFERAPVRLQEGDKEGGQDRRQQAPIHSLINSNGDGNRGQIANYGSNQGQREQLREAPRRKGKQIRLSSVISKSH